MFLSFGYKFKVDYVLQWFEHVSYKNIIHIFLFDSIHYFSTEIFVMKFIERLCLKTVLC